jgi:hypothetical protein
MHPMPPDLWTMAVDLSVICSSQGDDLEDIKRRATFWPAAMGDPEGARRQLTARFVGYFMGQSMGGCPQEWRTEVSQLGTVSDALQDVHPARRKRSTEVSALDSVRTGNAKPSSVGL